MHDPEFADAGETAEQSRPPEPPHPPPRARRRRGAWTGEGPLTAIEKKRLAARELRKAYGRIKADFSEAYEHCRNDAQRRALELAHHAAKQAWLRALDERSLDDKQVWRLLAGGFRPERARAERHLARLVAAEAVLRILKRLALIDAMLGALSD
ncbi:MAG: hypothetical protein JNM29_20790 [Candidatus Odyssella sp.]|nr:hypothetical protein [Candidatus Odyssella sp.]